MTTDIATARAPATPLVQHDPFFSIWSMTDQLTEDATRHWSHERQPLGGLLRIDGTTYRFIGPQPRGQEPIEAMAQLERRITPLKTVYRFAAGGIELSVSFTSPLLPDDLELLGRSATYIDLAVKATDGANHTVEAYVEAGSALAVGDREAELTWGRHRAGPVEALFLGAANQQPLKRSADEAMIEWGYLFAASAPGQQVRSAFGDGGSLRRAFVNDGTIPERDDMREVRGLRMPAISENRGLSFAHDFGTVGAAAEWNLLLAQDQIWAVSYFHRKLRPYWGRKGESAIAMIERAWAERDAVMARVDAFDAETVAALRTAGGDTYARLGTLAVRQCLAAHILAEDFDGTLLHFSKENSSNGSIGTVDVTYPAAPFFLHFNPALLEAQIYPVLDYARSGRWPFAYAPHDVGRYPHADGQNYGGGDRTDLNQMPVEECGNMLILVAALAHRTGELKLARTFLPQLELWADYLVEHGLDPANQLCTDDFAGHMPHNANLSIKAIVGLGSFAQLCTKLGKTELAAKYGPLAQDWAAEWIKMADDGDHYRLAFDQPGSWSQKYNLIWDRYLGLDLFPASVATTEMAHYKRVMNRYGLPLDSREDYTKLDWLVWSACLTGERADFDALLAPVATWLDDAPARVALSDWYQTIAGTQPRNHGFFGRSVVGGVFIKLMLDAAR